MPSLKGVRTTRRPQWRATVSRRASGFYDKGQYEQARASFLQAYALKKHPAVLINLAWSCLKGGHDLEAEKYFKQVLAEGKDITDKQRADANDGLTAGAEQARTHRGGRPAGTEVTVDGERIGTTPLSDTISVEAGAHTVKFKGLDGTTDTQSVTVLGGEKQQAHFGKGGGNATATVNPPPAATNPEPTPAPAPTESKPAEESKSAEMPKKDVVVESGGSTILSPPKNLVPLFVLGGVTIVGFGTAIALGVSKGNAQNQATQTANVIVQHGGGASTCSPAGLQKAPQFGAACSAYATDNNQVNQDATGANIAAGIGVAAALGFVIYYLVADKRGEGSSAMGPSVIPIVGHGNGGATFNLAF